MDDLEAIRRVISQTGMSQARAARLGGVPLRTLQRWMTGAARPKAGRARAVLKRLRRRCGRPEEAPVLAAAARALIMARMSLHGDGALARREAGYLLCTGADVRQAQVARLFGVSRVAVHKWMRQMEDRRDDPRLDAELCHVEEIMMAAREGTS